jgi:RNA polymerase sigma factor (sigma-70 family)
MAMEGVFGGEADSLERFCRSEWPRLVGALTLYTGDWSLAEELAQETVARVCAEWGRVHRLAAPGAWAHRVAMNLAHSHFRRLQSRRRATQRLLASQPAAPEHDVAGSLALRAAIARLPPRQQAALVLRYYIDLPVREVSEIMRCPEGTVKALTSRAMDALRRQSLLDDRPSGVTT